jgi:hypothetical protein
MLRPTWILLVVMLAYPAASDAGALGKAQLRSATGTLTISQTRCPPGGQPGSSNCGKLALTERFASGVAPRTRSVAGRTRFPTGLRIAGRGGGTCESESPTSVMTGPDGSVQLLTGSSIVNPGHFAATRIVAASGRRGLRIAWLEPLAPGIACGYFDERGALSLPLSDDVPAPLVSPVIAPRVLQRKRFGVTIAGSKDWVDQAQDGTQLAAHATWRLRLEFIRR